MKLVLDTAILSWLDVFSKMVISITLPDSSIQNAIQQGQLSLLQIPMLSIWMASKRYCVLSEKTEDYFSPRYIKYHLVSIIRLILWVFTILYETLKLSLFFGSNCSLITKIHVYYSFTFYIAVKLFSNKNRNSHLMYCNAWIMQTKALYYLRLY